jgi:hypothetical protein
VLALFWASASLADGLPSALQAAIFKKVLGYDKSLNGAAQVLVVTGAGDTSGGADLVKSFASLGITAEALDASKLTSESLGANKVAYLFPAATTPTVRALCDKQGVLTLSGDPTAADDGKVAIALGKKEDGRPEIIVNRATLKAEAHELSSELLRLAKIIQ